MPSDDGRGYIIDMWRASLRDLQWRKRRFLSAVGATSLVFGLTLLLSGASSSLGSQPEHIVRQLGADAWVVPSGTSGLTASTVLPAGVAAEVSAAPGVVRADPIVFLRYTIGDRARRDVNLIGASFEGLGMPTVVGGRQVRGEGETVADTALGLEEGSDVEIGGRRLRVVGLADGVSFNFGLPTVFVALSDAQALAFGGQPLATAILTRGVPRSVPSGLTILTNRQVISDLRRPAQQGLQTVDFINTLLWLVAAGIIGSIVYISVLERERDFAVMKAVGASQGALFAGLALQALVLSTAAVALAVPLARVMAAGFPFPVAVPLSACLRVLAVGIGVGLLTSLAGLRRVSAVDPALAFKGA